MAIIVQKFGGTSVGDIERIKHVAQVIKSEKNKGNQVVVVTSAMSGVTQKLSNDIASILENSIFTAESDTVVSSGEQIVAGLISLALNALNCNARSFSGWQIPIETDESYGKARILNINTANLEKTLQDGVTPVITGFQGVSKENRITTLGRGGSDTSAIAIAVALKADRCDIYTDVDGVYTSDPRIVQDARKLNKVAYEEMIEMSSAGSKVLQLRSIEMAMKYNLPVKVLSSFVNLNNLQAQQLNGTIILNESEVMERRVITAIASDRNEVQITVKGLPNTPGIAANLFAPISNAEINIDMIVQNIDPTSDSASITFTIGKENLQNTQELLEVLHKKNMFKSFLINEDVCKISVIGVGMRSHAGIAQRMFAKLAENNINLFVISTSEIKISVLIDIKYLEIATRILHNEYELS